MPSSDLTPAQLEQRSNAGLKHGGQSSVHISDAARAHKRRVLRQLGLRAGDLEGLGGAHLDQWSRAYSRVRAMDEWIAVHGWLDDKGNPPPFATIYFTALNTAARSLKALGEYLRESHGPTPLARLNSYLDAQEVTYTEEPEPGS